jgi:adenosylcobinamide-GDP ribazoletransferase
LTTFRDIARRLLPDLWSGFALLSRLPVPDHTEPAQTRPGPGRWSARCLGAWPRWSRVALWLGFTPGVVAALVLTLGRPLTGGLHEDGLSDTADGLFGGWTRERRLEIMKDSRVGSYGVLALVLVTLIRWSALTTILAAGSPWVLVAVGAISRAPMAVVMSALPNARDRG